MYQELGTNLVQIVVALKLSFPKIFNMYYVWKTWFKQYLPVIGPFTLCDHTLVLSLETLFFISFLEAKCFKAKGNFRNMQETRNRLLMPNMQAGLLEN